MAPSGPSEERKTMTKKRRKLCSTLIVSFHFRSHWLNQVIIFSNSLTKFKTCIYTPTWPGPETGSAQKKFGFQRFRWLGSPCGIYFKDSIQKLLQAPVLWVRKPFSQRTNHEHLFLQSSVAMSAKKVGSLLAERMTYAVEIVNFVLVQK